MSEKVLHTAPYANISVSGARIKTAAFDGLHPLVPVVFFTLAIVLSACAFHPWLCPISLLCGLAYSLVARGVRAVGKSMLWALPLVVLVALLNPFFSGQGATLVGTFLGRPLYFEGLVFGMCMGVLMAAMLVWAQNAACTITAEDALGLVGGVAPTVALVLSMVARFVPRTIKRGNAIAEIEEANSATAQNAGSKIVRHSRRFTTLLGSTMEDSLITADSMQARGWPARNARTTYMRLRFTRASKIALALVLGLGILAAVATWAACAGYNFYPYMDATPPKPIYLAFLAFFAVPLAMEAWEALKWKR